ncbi:MAG: 3-phosphoshikimate 1-carboxyvinyltransferase [Nitrososphaerota archaeon]|nr:3-phosphoshikimate 1-carboxyvinyltransferase [Candidatus Bathyarchaeota archaeon]MDW8193244.1 3-phosphoshikimate 1-carboxyvinyltransferase [Nitrososphaerota archaeon]
MVEVTIKPAKSLKGEVEAPPSKSYTHRMLIAALLSQGKTVIEKPLISDDTLATLEAIEAFGAEVKQNREVWEVAGQLPLKTPAEPVNCRESGATLRFMIPVAALAMGETRFIRGHGLSKRPIEPLLESLSQLDVKIKYNPEKPHLIAVQGGGIKGGRTTIRGDISSQFISGLMLACPMAQEDTEIALTTPVESKSYIEMTEEVLSRHSVRVKILESLIQVPSGQVYKPTGHRVPGDFSSAAYLLAAAAITSSNIKIRNLNYATKQGDRAIVEILEKAGLEVNIGWDFVEVKGSLCRAVDVNAKDIPDLVPACAAIACYTKGTSTIYNAGRLRYKESDRLKALYTEFTKMGADIKIEGDTLRIKGPCRLHGATIDPYSDHRIAMACTVAALGASSETVILNAECVRKSYPQFFRDLSLMGADIVGGELYR